MKKFFRIFLKGEPKVYYDFPVTDDALLSVFLVDLLARGYIAHDYFYVPHSEIAHVCIVQYGTSGQVVPFKPQPVA